MTAAATNGQANRMSAAECGLYCQSDTRVQPGFYGNSLVARKDRYSLVTDVRFSNSARFSLGESSSDPPSKRVNHYRQRPIPQTYGYANTFKSKEDYYPFVL